MSSEDNGPESESKPESVNQIDDGYLQRFDIEEIAKKRHIHFFLESESFSVFKMYIIVGTGAIFGALARLGLIALTTYEDGYLQGVVWANFAACFVMGATTQSTNVWSRLVGIDYQSKAAIPLYMGITTGFCGTFSSFSTAIEEVANRAINMGTIHYNLPNKAHGIMEFFSVTLTEFSLSLFGLVMGRHFISVVDKFIPPFSHSVYRVSEYGVMLLGFVSVIIAIVLTAVQNFGDWRTWTLSCIFAPFGAFMRYHLSKEFNSKYKNFPLGTFLANVSGSLVLCVTVLLTRGRVKNTHHPIVSNVLQCHVLNGIGDGFAGALSTISTYAVELYTLPLEYAHIYGLATVAIGFLEVLLIIGTYYWSVGLTSPVCD